MNTKENKRSLWKRKILKVNHVIVLTQHDPITMNTELINISIQLYYDEGIQRGCVCVCVVMRGSKS